jgi:hypothetical protein
MPPATRALEAAMAGDSIANACNVHCASAASALKVVHTIA